MHNVFPKSVRYRMLARRIYEDDGGVTTMTGKQWRDLAGVWRLTEKTQRDVKAGLEKVGLRVVSMPHTQGDVVVVYHPQTYAGRVLDRKLGREPLTVTEPYWWPLHLRKRDKAS